MVRKDGKTGSGIYKETPVRNVVFDMDEFAGGDGVEGPPATQFPCQVQGDSHFFALSPQPQWKKHRPLDSRASAEGAGL